MSYRRLREAERSVISIESDLGRVCSSPLRELEYWGPPSTVPFKKRYDTMDVMDFDFSSSAILAYTSYP